MAEAQRARWANDPGLRERVAAKLRGREITDRQRAALAACSARMASGEGAVERGRKISAALREHYAAHPMGPDQRKRLAEITRASHASGSRVYRGQPCSPEKRQKLSLARKRAWAKLRQAKTEAEAFARGIALAEAARQAMLARMRA
jgi:hypothetical protein